MSLSLGHHSVVLPGGARFMTQAGQGRLPERKGLGLSKQGKRNHSHKTELFQTSSGLEQRGNENSNLFNHSPLYDLRMSKHRYEKENGPRTLKHTVRHSKRIY